MSHGVRVTYYLRPYLADYLHHHYASHHQAINTLRAVDSPLVLWLNCTMGRKRADRKQVDAYAVGRTPYPVHISARRIERIGRHISLAGMRNFERLVYQQFMSQLIVHIRAHQRHRVEVTSSIIDFLLNCNISPDHVDADDLRRRVHKFQAREQAIARKGSPIGPNTAAPAAAPSPR